MQEALGRLPVTYREILLLCEFEEMSYQEISATLAIPMGTVMSRLVSRSSGLTECGATDARKLNHGLRTLE